MTESSPRVLASHLSSDLGLHVTFIIFPLPVPGLVVVVVLYRRRSSEIIPELRGPLGMHCGGLQLLSAIFTDWDKLSPPECRL